AGTSPGGVSRPASASTTRVAASSLSRAVSTQPAAPPPIMRTSQDFVMTFRFRPRRLRESTPAWEGLSLAGRADRELPYRDLDTKALLGLVQTRFEGDTRAIARVLVHNPAALYGF